MATSTTCQPRLQLTVANCVICQQALTRPKTLPCMHTCCEECLREFVFSRSYDAVGHFPCPTCRQIIQIPADGVRAFPDKFQIVGLLDSMALRSELFDSTGTDLLLCFGRHGTNVSDFTDPVGLAVNDCNNIIISDRRSNRIMTFDLHGKVKAVFGCRHGVSSIATTHRGTVVVASTTPGESLAIEYNNLTGSRIKSYGTFNLLEATEGVTVLPAPFQVVASSYETGTVYVMSDGGRLVLKFNRRSVIGRPYHMATTAHGSLIVSDYLNHRVVVVDRKTGQCRVQMGSIGTGAGSLYQPLGVCVDDHGNILVADSGNRRVVMFSSSGKFRGVVIDLSRSLGKPCNVVCVRGAGMLVVLVTGEGYTQVRVYSYHPAACCESPVTRRRKMNNMLCGCGGSLTV